MAGTRRASHEMPAEQHGRRGVQQHLEPLDHAAFGGGPVGQTRVDERDRRQHEDGDRRERGGEGLTPKLSSAPKTRKERRDDHFAVLSHRPGIYRTSWWFGEVHGADELDLLRAAGSN